MKMLVVTLAMVFGAALCLNAETVVYNVVDSHCGVSNWAGDTTWSKRRLKTKTITINTEDNSFVLTDAKGRTEVYSLLDVWNDNTTAVVQARDIMIAKGWEVTDYVAMNEYGHKYVIRMRTHSEKNKIQFFIYKGANVYAYDVSLS